MPWACSAEFRLPVATWRELIEHYYPSTGWIALREQTLRALQREKAKRALPTLDACVAELLEERVNVARRDSLLYEGYALYPYTPGATKNATPTPFGIVYPPAYAAALDSTYDHLELQCIVEGDGEITAEVRFLLPSGERHVRRSRSESRARASSSCGDVRVRATLESTRLKGSDPLRRVVPVASTT